MGGSIGVVIRRVSGTTTAMRRWTNPLPYFVNNLEFVQKSDAHLRGYMHQWYQMRGDWNRNKKNGKFKHNMTDMYAPYDGQIQPVSYGIVVLDWKSNHILDWQDYSGFGTIHTISVINELRGGSDRAIDDGYAAILRKFFDDGRVNGIQFWDPALGKVYVEPLSKFNITSFDALIQSAKDDWEASNKEWGKDQTREAKTRRWMSFSLDMQPFKLIRYDHNQIGELSKLKEKMLEIGFTFTESEDQLWDKYIKEHTREANV